MKVWQIAIIVIVSVIVTSLASASVVVLLNTPKNTVGYTGSLSNVPWQPAPNQTTTIPPNQGLPANPQSSLTLTNAAAIAQNYLSGNPDLAVKEVQEYSQNFYVQIYERSTGIGAFELTIDKYTGSVYRETGPSSTWNTKYGIGTYGYQPSYGFAPGPGMMWREGGMGAWFGGAPNQNLGNQITPYQAQLYAQQYLDLNYPGTVAGQVTTFYGYYTITVLNGGKVVGLLSVNGSNGQVWYHTWHGTFIQRTGIN